MQHGDNGADAIAESVRNPAKSERDIDDNGKAANLS